MILADSRIMTAEQAAKRAGCSNTWLRRLLDSGRAEGYRTYTAAGKAAGPWLVTEAEADRIGAELTTRATRNAARRKSLRKPTRAARRRG